MKKFSFVEFLEKISLIPGLSFLNRWVTEYRTTKSAVGQRVGDFNNYYAAGLDGVSDIRGAASDDSHDDDESDVHSAAGDSDESEYY
jgi:hypothetical protein